MAGGSQIIINDQGITIKTGGKVIFQAGQHKFESGEKIKTVFPTLPVMIDQPYSAAVTFLDDAKQPMVNYNYRLIAESGLEVSGITDEFGKRNRFKLTNEKKLIYILQIYPMIIKKIQGNLHCLKRLTKSCFM